MSAEKSHTEKLAELEQSNPFAATIYAATNRAALDREARLLREAEATASAEATAKIVQLFDPASKLGRLAAMRANGHHLMADLFEQNNAHELRRERDTLAREADPPSGSGGDGDSRA